MRKLLSFSAVSAAVLLLISSCSNEGTDVQPTVQKSTGTDHGYFYQCYVSSGSGSISFPQAGTYPGNFQANWSNVGDIVAGKGWNPGSSSRVINYNCGVLSGSYNFFGIYGWTTNPLIEYY